ncbi:MAG: D-glycero-alpha-D-manno-heptose-1,7-bisphosphate 7-phosphatase [Candidatus Margulisiibacteriota bacterium]
MTVPTLQAVLMDRDGTLIREKHYLSDPSQVELEEGAIEALSLLKAHNIPVILITNQSGIARGYFTQADFERVQAKLAELLAEHGLGLLDTFFCPHLSGCDCRKPQPGMLLSALAKHGLDAKHCVMIGDKADDVEAGKAAGVSTILVRTGHGASQTTSADYFALNILDAIQHLLAPQ